MLYISSQSFNSIQFSRNEEVRKITLLPFYGGGKGQSLQIIENGNGTITTNIIKTPKEDKNKGNKEEEINPAELEYPQLPSKFEKKFDDHVRLINNNALNILSLQDKAKHKGQLSRDEQNFFQTNLDEISEAAKELTSIQESKQGSEIQNREGLSAWFEKKNKIQAEKRINKTNESNKVNNSIEAKKELENSKWWNKTGEDSKKEDHEKKKKEKEEEKEKEKEKEEEKEEENGEEGGNDTVEINLPPDDASVAEAMPVGLAIAGNFKSLLTIIPNL